METAVECTHCKVVMTSWSAPGSPIRYYQCPFCARTHSSQYGEVFRSRAGARVIEGSRPAPASGIPMATAEDVRWARVKATAARWFARLEAAEQPAPPRPARAAPPVRPLPRAAAYAPAKALGRAAKAMPPTAADVPELDPDDVVEVAPVAAVAGLARKR